MKIDFGLIAVFILGTTKVIQKESTYTARLLQISSTWGSYFPNLYYVFGTNVFDHEFLTDRCKKIDHKNRHLLARTPQTVSRNETVLYRCNEDADPPQRNISSTLKVLWIGNCTGEYFGIGPSCRCQESMRYYLTASHLKHTQWFLFMDDDVYIRPYSLLSFLNALNVKYENILSTAFAIVSAIENPSFEFSKRWQQLYPDCHFNGSDGFPLAQPIIMTRQTVLELQSGINANGMTLLQEIWGGSHDAMLGIMLWLYNIPTYTMYNFYDTDSFYKGIYRRFDQDKCFVIHRVRNLVITRRHNSLVQEFGQQDMAVYLGDLVPYDQKVTYPLITYLLIHPFTSSHIQVIDEQSTIGGRAADLLHPMIQRDSGVYKTVFYEKAKNIKNQFSAFAMHECTRL